MISKLNFLEIRKDAIDSLKNDSSLFLFRVIYYVIPICIALSLHYLDYKIDSRLYRNLIGGISLFSGLLFSIIFVVSKNFQERKKQYELNDDETQNYLNRYKFFANSLIALISYTIIKALFIISILLIMDVYESNLNHRADYLLHLFRDVFIIFIMQYIIYVFVILNQVYRMQYDDINR